MKKTVGITVAFMAVSLLAASAVWAGPHGMGKGYGPWGALWNELSKDQQAQIGTLRIEFMKKANAIRSQIGQKRIEMAELANAPKPDEKAIQKKREEIWELQDALVKERRGLSTQIRSLLTPEQKEKLGPMAFMEGGPGCGMRGGKKGAGNYCPMAGSF